jgi:hypothetical protein
MGSRIGLAYFKAMYRLLGWNKENNEESQDSVQRTEPKTFQYDARVITVRHLRRHFGSVSKGKAKRLHNIFKADGRLDYKDCVSYSL